jgi:hypothetical protein
MRNGAYLMALVLHRDTYLDAGGYAGLNDIHRD